MSFGEDQAQQTSRGGEVALLALTGGLLAGIGELYLATHSAWITITGVAAVTWIVTVLRPRGATPGVPRAGDGSPNKSAGPLHASPTGAAYEEAGRNDETKGDSLSIERDEAGGEPGPRADRVVPDWFLHFFRNDYPELFRIAAYGLRLRRLNPGSAEDVVQEVLERQVKSGQWDIDAPKAYFRTAIINRVIDEARSAARKPVDPLPEDVDVADDSATAHFDRVAADDWCRTVLNELPPKQRAVMWLWCQGHDFREIAELLGMTEATARSNKREAKANLKRLFGQRDPRPAADKTTSSPLKEEL